MDLNELHIAKLTQLNAMLDDGFPVPRAYIEMAGEVKSGVILGYIEHLCQPETPINAVVQPLSPHPFRIIDEDGNYWTYRRDDWWWDELCLTARQAKRCLKILSEKDLIKIRKMSASEIMNVVMRKGPQHLTDPFSKVKTCNWCHCETYVLHEHHYPILARDNGAKTIGICANCHSEYHFLKTVKLLRINIEVKR